MTTAALAMTTAMMVGQSVINDVLPFPSRRVANYDKGTTNGESTQFRQSLRQTVEQAPKARSGWVLKACRANESGVSRHSSLELRITAQLSGRSLVEHGHRHATPINAPP